MWRFILPFSLACLALGTLRADVLISEFLADNQTGIEDENGDSGDWIELLNTGSSPVNLAGWWLTDNNLDKKQWTFPAVSIPANGTLLVWASGKNRIHPAAPLHTNFSLSRTGGFLGLYYPHPSTCAPVRSDTLGASYPAQAPDVSYGVTYAQSSDTLVGSGQNGRYRVLANNTTGLRANVIATDEPTTHARQKTLLPSMTTTDDGQHHRSWSGKKVKHNTN
jgi:hypothetical protein